MDRKLREKTQFELVNIQEKVGVTFIMVTHDQEEAMTMSTRIGVMHEGSIRQIGSPTEIYEYPNSQHVAQFIGSMNFFEGIVEEENMTSVLVMCDDVESNLYISQAAPSPVGAKVTVAIRPEKIQISATPPNDYTNNYVHGTINDIAYLGDVSIYYVKISSGKILMAQVSNAMKMGEIPLTWNDEIYLYWRPENGIVLSA